jgi:hypothetical protein
MPLVEHGAGEHRLKLGADLGLLPIGRDAPQPEVYGGAVVLLVFDLPRLRRVTVL